MTIKILFCFWSGIFNQYVLPILTLEIERWLLTHQYMHTICVAQRAMERATLGLHLVDRVPNDVGTRVA